jgi:hypothetical protein
VSGQTAATRRRDRLGSLTRRSVLAARRPVRRGSRTAWRTPAPLPESSCSSVQSPVEPDMNAAGTSGRNRFSSLKVRGPSQGRGICTSSNTRAISPWVLHNSTASEPHPAVSTTNPARPRASASRRRITASSSTIRSVGGRPAGRLLVRSIGGLAGANKESGGDDEAGAGVPDPKVPSESGEDELGSTKRVDGPPLTLYPPAGPFARVMGDTPLRHSAGLRLRR